MAYWNYRVIVFDEPGGGEYRAIHEVHYDDGGQPYAYSENPAVVLWQASEGRATPHKILAMIGDALTKPALHAADFVGAAQDSREG